MNTTMSAGTACRMTVMEALGQVMSKGPTIPRVCGWLLTRRLSDMNPTTKAPNRAVGPKLVGYIRDELRYCPDCAVWLSGHADRVIWFDRAVYDDDAEAAHFVCDICAATL